MQEDIFSKAKEAAFKIGIDFGDRFDAALVLGSGLSLPGCDFTGKLLFSDVFEIRQPQIAGHPGRVLLAENFFGCRLLVMQGRYHYYEGYSPLEVILPVLALAELKVGILILTNAAGGLNPSFRRGDLMVINDHINLTGINPLVGIQPPAGTGFVDMSEAYDKKLRNNFIDTAKSTGIEIKQGVYVGVSGPSYETPAELDFLRRIGGDAVGMSTVLEVIGARFAGLKVAALSVITNQPADEGKVDHLDVLRVSSESSGKLSMLLTGFCESIKRKHAKGKGDLSGL